MFAALIFVMSVAMAAQFAIHFWRSAFLATASLPVSERIQMARESISDALNNNDFGAVTSLTEICPDLGSPAGKFGLVRAYYQLLRGLASFSNAVLPSASKWAQSEMAACTRFVAVSMDIRLKSNEALLAELRSY
jgi:hypothetical protein